MLLFANNSREVLEKSLFCWSSYKWIYKCRTIFWKQFGMSAKQETRKQQTGSYHSHYQLVCPREHSVGNVSIHLTWSLTWAVAAYTMPTQQTDSLSLLVFAAARWPRRRTRVFLRHGVGLAPVLPHDLYQRLIVWRFHTFRRSWTRSWCQTPISILNDKIFC